MLNTDKTILLPQLQRYDQKIKGWADNKFLTKADTPSLPKATTTTLGGVKVGNGLNVTDDGTLSAEIAEATEKTSGVVYAKVNPRIPPKPLGRVYSLQNNGLFIESINNDVINSEHLATKAVTAGKIADSAVNAAKLANNAVTANKIVDGAVTSAKLASNAVTADKIADGAITADKIADGVIGSASSGTIQATGIAPLNLSVESLTDGGSKIKGSLNIGPGLRVEAQHGLLMPSVDYETIGIGPQGLCTLEQDMKILAVETPIQISAGSVLAVAQNSIVFVMFNGVIISTTSKTLVGQITDVNFRPSTKIVGTVLANGDNRIDSAFATVEDDGRIFIEPLYSSFLSWSGTLIYPKI